MNRPNYLLFKQCSKCREVLHASRFYKDKKGKYGLRSICKECKRKQDKEYKEEHKEELKEYREEHKEELKEYREEHKDYYKEYSKQYYEDNKEYIKERSKQYYEDNKDYYKEYNKEYYKNNKDKISEKNKQWREGNKDKVLEYNKKWHKNNPEKLFNKHNRRRGKLENQGRGITKEQWKECFNWFDWKCAYSGEKLQNNKTTNGRTIDHIVALDNGGLNEPWNIVPMKKGYNTSKHIIENVLNWYIEQEYFDIDRLDKIVEWQVYAYEKWGGEEFGELILITDLFEDK